MSDMVGRVDGLTQELDRLGGRVTSLERQFAEAFRLAPASVQQVAPQPLRPGSAPGRADDQTVFVNPPVVRVSTGSAKTASVVPTRTTTNPAPRPGPAAAGRMPVTPAPVEVASPATLPKRSLSLEERLGQNWLNKLGIVTLVTGFALLLGYELRTLGPVGKSVMGVLLSLTILVTGLILERRKRYRLFARAAIGGGWALLYFVSFAIFHVPAMQVLRSQTVDLLLMLVVATGMVVHSLRYCSQVVTSLAFLLGFFTASISHVTVFSLVASAILATGLIAVAFRQRWFAMALGGLVAVYLNHFLWLHRVLPDGGQAGHPFPAFMPSAALLLLYWLLFRAFYISRIPENGRDSLLSTAKALLNSAGLLTLMKYQSSHPEWAFPGLLALGAAELAMAFAARRRRRNATTLILLGSVVLLYAQVRRRHPSYLLSQVAIERTYTWSAAALVSLLAWYALQPAAVSVAWCAQGVILLEIGLVLRAETISATAALSHACALTNIRYVFPLKGKPFRPERCCLHQSQGVKNACVSSDRCAY